MIVSIPADLQRVYEVGHKNYDMALMTLLDSFDPVTFLPAFETIEKIVYRGEKTDIEIGDSVIDQVISAFEEKVITNNDLITTLLWIAVLFPEI